MGVGLWAEAMRPEEVRAALGALSAAGARLCLSLPVADMLDPAFATLTRDAADAGVPVRAWLLLPERDGYWIGSQNVPLAARAIEQLLDWTSRRGGPALEGVSFDLEPDLDSVELVRRGGWRASLRLLAGIRDRLDRREHLVASAALGRAVEAVKRRRLRAHCVTYPFVLDQPRGSEALEDALDINVSGVEWDEISVMVYQTAFQQVLGFWPGSALVHAYARAAEERWGERAGVDLGVVGSHGVALGAGGRYEEPARLADDVAAVLAAGVPLERVRVYGLAGILQQGGVARWIALERLTARRPARSRSVAGLRASIGALAAALEQVQEARSAASRCERGSSHRAADPAGRSGVEQSDR